MKSQITTILAQADPVEIQQFSDWMASPAHVSNPRLKKLWDFLVAYASDFLHPACTREQAFIHLFGEKPYSRLPINNLLSDLWYQYLDFLAYQRLSHEKALQHQWVVESLLQKEEISAAEKQLNRWRKSQEEVVFRSVEYHQQTFQLHAMADRLFLRQSQRAQDLSLQAKNDHLDLSFFIQKFQLACEMTSRNLLLKTNYRFSLLEELEQALAKWPHLGAVPAIEIYRRILALLQQPDESQHYLDFKVYLLKHESLFTNQELNDLYGYALNYCIQRINYGHSTFYQEILELYQQLLPKGLLWQEGHLNHWTFRNIVTAGIRTESFAWTEAFIQDYQQYLPTKDRENAVRYNLAAFHYARRDYQQALRQLHGVEFTDNFYQLGAKTIQLKSYFELEEGEAFLALSEAFRKYLVRHAKLSDYHRTSNQHFLRLTKRLFKLKQSPKASRQHEQKKSGLGALLQETRPLANKDWLEQEWQKL